MKHVHTSIIDKLLSYGFDFNDAIIIADNSLEYGFNSLLELELNIYDYLMDYISVEKALSIAKEIIQNI
jgi:hypothetical protein